MNNNKFNIGDKVYHILPDSPIGVIIEIKYIYSLGRHEYQVAFDAVSVSNWYYEHELTRNRNFQ